MIYLLSVGALAQLGERFHGMEEVVGSIPISSTSEKIWPIISAFFIFRFNIWKNFRKNFKFFSNTIFFRILKIHL